MRCKNKMVYGLIYLMLLPFTCFSSPIDETIKYIESEIPPLQGGAIAILHNDNVIYKKTFGFTKNDSDISINEFTLFPLASVSKAVTSVAVAKRVSDGKLDLEHKYKIKYLSTPVSAKDIMSHSTGYSVRYNGDIEQGVKRGNILLKLQKDKPSCFVGKCYTYNNIVYSLIDEILLQDSYSFENLIGDFKKSCHINGLVSVNDITDYDNIAYPHSRGGALLPFPKYYPKTAPASAGLFASINDMIEVYKLSFGYKSACVKPEITNLMQTPVIKSDDIMNWGLNFPNKNIKAYYGIGWRILELNGNKLIFHPGMINGINSIIAYIPSQKIGMIILLNQNSGLPIKAALNMWYSSLGLNDDISS